MLKNDNTQYLKVCKKEKHTGFPSGSVSKESTCNAGNLSSIPRSGRSPGEGNGYPFQKNRNYNTIFSSVQSLSCVQLFATPWTIQSIEIIRPENWVGSISLLQEIFPTQGSNSGFLHCRQILYQLSHKGIYL